MRRKSCAGDFLMGFECFFSCRKAEFSRSGRGYPGEHIDSEILYRWRNINADPYNSSGLVKTHKSGVIFSARNENSNLIPIVKEAENFNSDINIKYNMKGGAAKFLSWLEKQPEIILAEGTPRKIPSFC